MEPVEYCDNLFKATVTIPNNEAASDGVPTQGYALVAILMPILWTAAGIGFQTSLDGVSYKDVYDSGANPLTTDVKVVSTVPQHIAFPQTQAIFGPYLKLTSVTYASVTPVNQGGARVLTLIFRKLFS